MPTLRLYYDDPRLTSFAAAIIEVADEGRRIYLDRSAFYPTSGGQPHDGGTLGGIAIADVIDEDDRIAHVLAEPWTGPAEASGSIDWARRFDHMQQHTGQHLLSGVVDELYAIDTLSFHLGADSSTIDIAVASLTPGQLVAIEKRANEIVCENRPVTVSYEHSATAIGLRKESLREGTLRIVTIADYDRSACGGTHVESTGAIGAITLRKMEKIRGNLRLEFLCGARATNRARRDFDALSEIARGLTSPVDEAPALVAAMAGRLQESDRVRRKLGTELAGFRGRQIYSETEPDGRGRRRVVQTVAAIDEDTRAFAQGFCAAGDAVFLAVNPSPPSVLLAAGRESGVDAGSVVKAAVASVGGRGGGNAQAAQGSVPSAESLEEVVRTIEEDMLS